MVNKGRSTTIHGDQRGGSKGSGSIHKGKGDRNANGKTAGRDRTGVLSGLLLSLAGTPPDLVELDFMLSRIGTEPAREQLLAFALKGSGAESVDAPGFYNLCSLKVQCWRAFVKGVEREYGGWEGYVTKQLGFSPAELETIKRNLVTPR
jgi:protein tyrosine/serine phosphatase